MNIFTLLSLLNSLYVFRSVLRMAMLPAAFEIGGIAVYAVQVMNYTRVEGLVLGTVLTALGDGLVIPKMQEFSRSLPQHDLPRLVFTWAPLEASFVLTSFGILTGVASPEDQEPTSIWMILLANLVRILATLLAGGLLGGASALCTKLVKYNPFGIFKGSSSEMLLILVATALAAFALGKGAAGHELVPMPFCPGSLFQPELLVIVTGACFAHVSNEEVLHDLEHTLGEVWSFGQIILFSMLGSKITPDLLPSLGAVFPVMMAGLLMRFLGVACGLLLTCQSKGLWDLVPDTLFCFLCTLPRATIQGALGGEPKKMNFFSQGCSNSRVVQDYIFTAAQLYILCYSVIGMVLLHTVGPRLLKMTLPTKEEESVALKDAEEAAAWCIQCFRIRFVVAKRRSVIVGMVCRFLEGF